MKKLTRKLFVSIMTLVLTAMALGTSTFAWFSTNGTVEATGMQVTAKTDSTFLIIGGEGVDGANATGVAYVQAHPGTSATAKKTAGPADDKVYPAAVNQTGSAIAVSAAGQSGSIADGAWYTAGSDNIDSASGTHRINVKAVSEGSTDYMNTYKLYITLAGPYADGEDIQTLNTKKLQVTATLPSAVSGTTDGRATSCVVVIGSERFVLKNANNNTDAATLVGETSSAISLRSDTLIEITVYVYVNGENDITKTRTIMDRMTISGTVGLQFDLVD